MSRGRTLVLGIGNLLLGDEGVGVHAARALEGDILPEGTDVLEVGTAILEALPALEGAERVVVIDAVEGGEAPGTVYRMPLAEAARKETIASLHGFDLERVLALAGRAKAPEVVVIGVEPQSLDWSLDLSPAVAAALPAVLEQVKKEISP